MKKIKCNAGLLAIVQFTVLFFLIINYVVHDITLGSVIKIFLFQFFLWMIVGYTILMILRISVRNFVEVLALSYALGGVASIITYIIFMLPGLGFLLPYFLIVESIFALFFLYTKGHLKIEKYENDIFAASTCILFLIVYFVLSTCAVSFVNTMPNETLNGMGYHPDWAFWGGNNISFTKSFPGETFRQVGVPFKYHYFSSILIAYASLCTGVDVNQISFYFSSILAGIIFIFSGYYFASRVVKDKFHIIILMLAVLFTDGTIVTYTWHTNICPFGFDYGYAYGMLSIAVLAEILLNERRKELFILSVLLLAMTTGCKGPMGVIVLAAYGVAAIDLIRKRMVKQGILYGASWLTTFISIYLIFIRDQWTTDSSAGLQYIGGLGVDTIVAKAPWVASFYDSILTSYKIHGDWLPIKLYAIWLYVYRADKIIGVLLIIAIISVVRNLFRRKMDSLLNCLVISALAGVILAIYTIQSGGSQMYFMMAMFPSAGMAGMYALESLRKNITKKNNNELIYNLLTLVVVFTLIISICSYGGTILNKAYEGISAIRNNYTAEDYERCYTDGIDYEAYAWLKDNTENNSIFAMDSFVNAYGGDNYMMAGLFSERYVWNEEKYAPNMEEVLRRNNIVLGLQMDIEGALKSMKNEGVDYVMSQISTGKAEYGTLTNNLTELFRNEHYIIYQIN